MADTSKYTLPAARKKEFNTLTNDLLGKLPPQARDLEEAVLGAAMLEKDAVSKIIDILKPESFYEDAHQLIYTAIRDIFARSEPIDLLTVTEELRESGKLDEVGGPLKITTLTSRVASAANIEYHARIISQKYVQRELITISNQVINDAYDDTTDVFTLLDKAEQNLFAITDQNLRRNYEKMSTLVKNTIEEINEIRNKEGMSGVPSGFNELDKITGGWQPSDLIIIAARPGMGKTAFTLSMARNMAVDYKKPVAFFSLEMSSGQLTTRLLSSEAELSASKLRKGDLMDYEIEQLTHKAGKIADAPLFIDDTAAINIFELRAKCRRLKMQHDIQMIIIDYLQLMSGTDSSGTGNREQEISKISRSLKSIAKELEIPIVALSQLNRSVETRGGDKRPQLSDLRESGAIEQDADMVMFIYRPEYYDILEDSMGRPTKGLAELIISKHRNGALGTVLTRFIGQFAKFTNLSETEDADFMDLDKTTQSQPSVITRSSSMNGGEEDSSEELEDPPF